MSWLDRNDRWKEAAIARCDRSTKIGKRAYKNNYQASKFWGKAHIVLGLIATFFATASAVLTFYTEPKVVAAVAFFAALSSGYSTFLNPSRRELRRRTAASNYLNYLNRIEDLRLKIECSEISRSEMFSIFESIDRELRESSKELLIPID